MPVDWHQLAAERHAPPPMVDSRRRMRFCLALVGGLLAVVLIRAVQLEWSHGAAFRAEANRPLRRERELPAPRGRIFARDGTLLAIEQRRPMLLIHYGRLQPPLDETQRDLARRCGVPWPEWRRRAAAIRHRVERIAESVSRRLGRETLVAEQIDYHLMADRLPEDLAVGIRENGEAYPGARVVERSARVYPAGQLAAHVVGYLGPAGSEDAAARDDVRPDDLIGRDGVERQFDDTLRGRRGKLIEWTDHGGTVLRFREAVAPRPGRDVWLTLDPELQRAAERLLDAAVDRARIQASPDVSNASAGGAIVVMDVDDGSLRVAASSPRFDPADFVDPWGRDVGPLLDDSAAPLLNRVAQMALPPGSVMKVVTAAALLDRADAIGFDPDAPFHCQGYLHRPNALRCALFRRRGQGHGDVTLGDAICQSCNVYFFHHAERLGAESLIAWADRLGLGRPTGIALPGEAAGTLPTPATIESLEGHPWNPGDTYALSVGQGSMTATPLQIARMMAAIAADGRLVRPRLVERFGSVDALDGESAGHLPHAGPQRVDRLDATILDRLHAALRQVVADPRGTAHATANDPSVALAGKTGTAETAPGRPAHGWFAGYLPGKPEDKPRWVIVVALEHAGDAGIATGPVVRRLAGLLSEGP